MELIYSLEPMPERFESSIFLAGPTYRKEAGKLTPRSWRADALDTLEQLGYQGVVFVPEDRDPENYTDYTKGLYPEWEHTAFARSDCVIFWVPRDMEALPGLTTNVEYGLMANSGKSVFGAPPEAPNNGYLKNFCAKKYGIPVFETLFETIQEAVSRVTPGELRVGGECEVQLELWKTESFRKWYEAQLDAGNRLNGFKPEWLRTFNHDRARVWAWAALPDIYVDVERRNKNNDTLVCRTDIACAVLVYPAPDLTDSLIVLTREFRSAVNNSDGMVWSVPGGSTPDNDQDAVNVAAEEVYEETGWNFSPDRFEFIGVRQLMASFSAHKANVFKVEITRDELDYFVRQRGVTHGVDACLDNSGERTYVEVLPLRRIIEDGLVDWSTLGMIFSAL